MSLHVKLEINSHDRLKFANTETREEVRTKPKKKIDVREGLARLICDSLPLLSRFRWAQCQLDIWKLCTSRPELE